MPSLFKAGNLSEDIREDICPGMHSRCFVYFGLAVFLAIIVTALIVCFICYKKRLLCWNNTYTNLDEGNEDGSKVAAKPTYYHRDSDGFTDSPVSVEDEKPTNVNCSPPIQQEHNKDVVAQVYEIIDEQKHENSKKDKMETETEQDISQVGDTRRDSQDINTETRPVDNTSNPTKQPDNLSTEYLNEAMDTATEQCREDETKVANVDSVHHSEQDRNTNEDQTDEHSESVKMETKSEPDITQAGDTHRDSHYITSEPLSADITTNPNKQSDNESIENISEAMDTETETCRENLPVIDNDIHKINKGVSDMVKLQINVQVYSTITSSLTVQNVCKALMSKLMFEIDYSFVQDIKTANPDNPLLIICMFSSRLGTDAKNAIKGLQHPATAGLVILHCKEEHALPKVRSDRVLVDSDVKTVAKIFDFAYTESHGMYSCDMNTTCIQEIEGFIGRFMKPL